MRAIKFILTILFGLGLTATDAQPIITSFSPTSGCEGTQVTIYGAQFTGVTKVKFGGLPAASFTIVSSTMINAIVGTGASGNVSVTNANGKDSLRGFIFFTPTWYQDLDHDGYGSTAVSQTSCTRPPNYAAKRNDCNDNAASINPATIEIHNGVDDNCNGAVDEQVTTITSFNPTSGPVGTTVVITGTNFSSTPANNIVFFGATKASVIAASSTKLKVAVPAGATYQPITVTTNNLTAYSAQPFIVTFAGGGEITDSSFAPKIDFLIGNGYYCTYPQGISIGDLNEDDKSEIVSVTQSCSEDNKVSVLKNTGTSGTIAFDASIDYPGYWATWELAIADIDGDGKKDLVVNDANVGISGIWILRNTSTEEAISFAPALHFATDIPADHAIGDLDGDGKPDIVVTSFGDSISIFRNTSTPGNISLAPKINYSAGQTYGIAINDLDGDGKPDLAVANITSGVVSVFINSSYSNGVISFEPKLEFPVEATPYHICSADFDGDGKPDLATANCDDLSVSVLKNTSSQGLVSFDYKIDYMTGYWSLNTSAGDLDGDGKADLAVMNEGSVSLFKNNSTSGVISFGTKVDLFPIGNESQGFAIGDLDGDGKPDIAAGNTDYISVFRNQMQTPPVQCVTPTTLSTTDITGTSAKLNWNIVPAAVNYKVHYKVAGSTTWINKTANQNSIALTGLTTKTNYTWQVRTTCSNNPKVMSAWSSKKGFTTGSLKLTNARSTSFDVYPNPFESSTTISFSVAEDSRVQICLYDVAGKLMQTVLNENVSAGDHTINLNRSQFIAGVYLLKLQVNDQVIVRKVVIE